MRKKAQSSTVTLYTTDPSTHQGERPMTHNAATFFQKQKHKSQMGGRSQDGPTNRQ
jgi:hypothetical protein